MTNLSCQNVSRSDNPHRCLLSLRAPACEFSGMSHNKSCSNMKTTLTVRMCFLRMYKKKLHSLDVTPRKVRTPSRHWRVFSMSTITPESVRCDLHRWQEQHNTPVEIRSCQPFTTSHWSVPMHLTRLDMIQINVWRVQKCSVYKKVRVENITWWMSLSVER